MDDSTGSRNPSKESGAVLAAALQVSPAQSLTSGSTNFAKECGPVSAQRKNSLRSSRSLTSVVSRDLVRGVPLRHLLSGGSRIFRASSGDEYSRQRFTQKCSHFDIFLSHDWATSRWLKYATLLLLFNSKAAALATLAVSLAVGMGISFDVLPNQGPKNNGWALSIGYLTFLVFILFWQNIRDSFLKSRLAFLDKLTIPQNDAQIKEECILGLAGFLSRSRKLVILFSESYTHRLWCVYELAAYVQLYGEQGQIQAIPVRCPLLLLMHAAWWLSLRLLVFLVWNFSGIRSRVVLTVCSTFVMFCITFPFQYWKGRQLTKSLQGVTQQLREFEVHDTKCFCCSTDHQTKSGQSIPCDRELMNFSKRGMARTVIVYKRPWRDSTMLSGPMLLIGCCHL